MHQWIAIPVPQSDQNVQLRDALISGRTMLSTVNLSIQDTAVWIPSIEQLINQQIEALSVADNLYANHYQRLMEFLISEEETIIGCLEMEKSAPIGNVAFFCHDAFLRKNGSIRDEFQDLRVVNVV